MQHILIVGAGPTGLTAAIELRRRGIACRIVDRKEKQSTLSRAVGINPHSLDLLEPSGVTEQLLAQGIHIRKLDIHDAQGERLGQIHANLIPHRFNFLLALPQDKTEIIMHDRLQAYGGQVEYNTIIKNLVMENEKARVSISQNGKDSEEIFDLVIAADGSRSVIRSAVNIPFPGYDYKNMWSLADFESKDLPYARDEAHLFILESGVVGVLIRIGENRFRAVASRENALQHIPGKFTVDKVVVANNFHIGIRQAESYQKGCIYLAGDAAHIHSPAGGRGMNLGIDDACDLAKRIAEGGLEDYTKARHPVGEQTIALSERLVRGISLRNPAAIFVRNTAFRILTRFPTLQKPLVKQLAGI